MLRRLIFLMKTTLKKKFPENLIIKSILTFLCMVLVPQISCLQRGGRLVAAVTMEGEAGRREPRLACPGGCLSLWMCTVLLPRGRAQEVTPVSPCDCVRPAELLIFMGELSWWVVHSHWFIKRSHFCYVSSLCLASCFDELCLLGYDCLWFCLGV